jgi:hypothetical protein
VRGTVETPAEGAAVPTGVVTITGWATDLSANEGTGITGVRVALDADPDQGGIAVPALYGWERPDIAALLGGSRWLPTGFALAWDSTGIPPGAHVLHIQVRNACGWTGTQRAITVTGGPGGAAMPARPGATGPSVSGPTPTPTRGRAQ